MKVKRQSKILELIRENDIETQEMLADLLNKAGFNVTQATVSRDIRELKLTKATMQSGKQKYVATAKESSFVTERLNRVFRDGIVSIDYAQNIVVIKTLIGMAMAVAAALDSMENSEIMGTIAGDDTIFCVVKNESRAIKLTENLKAISLKIR
ncbi:MAG: arginine repressor [Lachnospirales bacterium]